MTDNIIRPGDHLLIVAPYAEGEQMAKLDDSIRQSFPGVLFTTIYGPVGSTGMRIVGHYRPDPCACWDVTSPSDTEAVTRHNPACPQHGRTT